MTSEIVLLNRRAVALAADSATTVQYRENGRRKQRHFKGTNKIFHLASANPVAIMTYDSGNVQGVPWEVIIKAYRSHLGDGSHSTLTGYSADFFNYIQTNTHLHSLDFREKQFAKDLVDMALIILYLFDPDHTIEREVDIVKKQTLADARMSDVTDKIEKSDFIGNTSQRDVDELLAKLSANVVDFIKENEVVKAYQDVLDIDKLINLGVLAVFKYEYTTLETTGLVVAGFGHEEYFPKLESYICYGFVLDRLLYRMINAKAIDQENVSEIVPFAQTSMAKGFMYGIAPEVLLKLDKEFVKAVDGLESELIQSGVVAAGVDLETQKELARNNFSNALISDSLREHAQPMKRVVGVLPVDELAELAEFLVKMESLKERATRETEEVSGPIDVAVITKGDGFIWIKRKLYFDAKLNPRYFTRKGMAPHA